MSPVSVLSSPYSGPEAIVVVVVAGTVVVAVVVVVAMGAVMAMAVEIAAVAVVAVVVEVVVVAVDAVTGLLEDRYTVTVLVTATDVVASVEGVAVAAAAVVVVVVMAAVAMAVTRVVVDSGKATASIGAMMLPTTVFSAKGNLSGLGGLVPALITSITRSSAAS